tara:strand:+ start:2025 stop:2522 length:498 start_codon:yes stop_codon:yes gene_type:complete
MSEVNKGVELEVEVNNTKPMSTEQWKKYLQGFEERWVEIAEDNAELEALKKANVSKDIISKKENRLKKKEERLLSEEKLHHQTYHEKGKKRRAVSSKIESAIFSMLEGKDREELTEMVSQHRSLGTKITTFLRNKDIKTTKVKNGGEEVDAYPTCSTKWDNDNEV